jgi:dTDP-4-amino-4,6-dideoxygalactose transaminase
MAVHLHGLPVDLDSILELATERGIPVLEDFSQAVGAAYRGRKVGSWGKVGAASLMAGKNLPSAGEAGILVTNERLVRNMAATLKCFGEAINEKGAYQPLHETYGYNYRANLLALGFASTQLFRIDAFTEERRRNAARLSAVLDKIPGFTTPCDSEKAEHVYHMYRFRFEPEKAGLEITADQAREGLKQIFLSEGLPLVEFQNQPLSDHALMKGSSSYGSGWPWHREPSFQRDAGPESFPGALDAIRHSLVVGFPAKAPMANSEVVDHYIACFQKLSQNMRSFERIAARLEAHPPWHQEARLF